MMEYRLFGSMLTGPKPCHEGELFFDIAVQQMDKNIKVGTVNVISSPVLSAKYSVWGLPNVLIFKNGQLVKRLSGVLNTASYQNAIHDVINKINGQE